MKKEIEELKKLKNKEISLSGDQLETLLSKIKSKLPASFKAKFNVLDIYAYEEDQAELSINDLPF